MSVPNYRRTALPIVGHTYMFPVNPSRFFKFITDVCASEQTIGQKFTKLWIGPQPVMLVHHPDVAEVLMKSSKLIEKAEIYQLLHPWLGTGLLTSGGEKWSKRRRLLTPAFHFSILKDFLEVMNDHSNQFVTILKDKCDKGIKVDLGGSITMCALDIICETAMGETVNAQTETNSVYVKALYEISEIIMDRFRNPFLQNDSYFNVTSRGRRHNELLKVLHGFSGSVIRNRLEQVKNEGAAKTGKSGRMAFLDLLLHTETDDGKRLSFADIQEEVDTFMFEGHDTTAAALTWMFYQLGLHQNVQKQLQQEIDSVIDEDTKHLTVDDFKQMPYLEQVIKESLRHYPSVPYIARRITEECKFDGYTIPVDVEASIMCYSIHHHPDYWKDPYKFDPSRFTKENQVGRHAFSYIPFSAGFRNCIGQKFAMQEMKTLVCKVMKNFDLVSHDDESTVEKSGELILRPGRTLNIELTRRKM